MSNNITKTDKTYFHCYATANESHLYLKDIQNLSYIKNNYSGYEKVHLYIAVSEVKEQNNYDKCFFKMAKSMFYNHASIILKEIYFKSNIGRDFSSFESLFHKVNKNACEDDYILFQNRSGFGPCRDNWYQEFVTQFEKFDSIAICGSTISFKDHAKRSSSYNVPHIQTYSFLTKVSYMKMLEGKFPGAKETNRYDIICNGEIGLSQFFLNIDYKITCIEWPNEVISKNSEPISKKDVKRIVTQKHFFYHREYFKRNPKAKTTQYLIGLSAWINTLKGVSKK
tara:strand:- start:9447 stop:10292 length:846 start_codon:yes stop_codon:yes gene_type:complete